MLIASCRRMQQRTVKDFFRTILTRVAGLGLEPQTIEAEAEAATLKDILDVCSGSMLCYTVVTCKIKHLKNVLLFYFTCNNLLKCCANVAVLAY